MVAIVSTNCSSLTVLVLSFSGITVSASRAAKTCLQVTSLSDEEEGPAF